MTARIVVHTAYERGLFTISDDAGNLLDSGVFHGQPNLDVMLEALGWPRTGECHRTGDDTWAVEVDAQPCREGK